jgi:hypothetical protein
MIDYNPFTFEERVKKLYKYDKSVLFDLEPVRPRIAIILLMTDEDKKIHVYVNGKRSILSGQVGYMQHSTWLIDQLEKLNRNLKGAYHIIKVEAFLPYSVLKKLYFPLNYIPKQKDFTKRLFKASRG